MTSSRKHTLHLFLVIALVVSAIAQQSAPSNAPSVERLRAHVEYLAADKLEGRLTASPGANLAAEYIAREFSRYGLRRSIGYDTPGMSRIEADSPNRYLQKFPYVAGAELGKNNALSVTSVSGNVSETQGSFKTQTIESLEIGEDWMPLGFSSSGKVLGAKVVFAGYGISASELKHDDYALTNAKDKVAVILSGTPDGENAHGQFARYDDVRWKAVAARNAGAAALLVISKQQNLKDDRASQLSYDHGGDAGLPVAVISRQAAANVFQTDDAGLDKLERSRDGADQFPLVDLYLDVVRREVSAYNVVGILDGSDPVLKNETIVIGAHCDHLGRGGRSSLAARAGEIHYGADDNASGVAGVLELARLFSAQRPRRTIVFAAFSGEEEGLLGSNYYVNHPVVPLNNTVAMINMDMIGRMKDNKLIVGGVGTAEGWRQVLSAANSNERLTVTATPQTSGEITPTSTSSGSHSGRSIPIVTGINGRAIVSSTSEKSFDLSLNQDGFGPSDH